MVSDGGCARRRQKGTIFLINASKTTPKNSLCTAGYRPEGGLQASIAAGRQAGVSLGAGTRAPRQRKLIPHQAPASTGKAARELSLIPNSHSTPGSLQKRQLHCACFSPADRNRL